MVKARRACSLVCPSLDHPDSNSPGGEAIMRMATSAWEVPVIMFLMKSLCPGASIMVKTPFSDSNFQRAISMVIPLSLCLEFIENPCVLERFFTHFSGFLLELFDSSLFNTTALVNKMTGRG